LACSSFVGSGMGIVLDMMERGMTRESRWDWLPLGLMTRSGVIFWFFSENSGLAS
jgi:hypothetical protein